MRVHCLAWEKALRPADLLTVSTDEAEYIVVARPQIQSFDPLVGRSDLQSPAEIVIAYDPIRRAQWERLREVLPPFLFCLAAPPEHELAIAVAVAAIKSQPEIVNRSESISELVVRLAETRIVTFVASPLNMAGPQVPVPELSMPSKGPRNTWLRDIIPRIQLPGVNFSQTNLTAFKAGLFLINDFFNDSHECSQSIEGKGTHHTGDYWHAILHRREPDYGNAKYWFRHVGPHPAFDDLTPIVQKQLAAATGSLPDKLGLWKERLESRGWDPLAFVDLCEAAEQDAELKHWCEQIQFAEMLVLLEYSLK